MFRENYEGHAKEIEEKIKNKLNRCGYSCKKNPNKYDIDIVAVAKNGQTFYVEVEESSSQFWPSDKPKPTVLSNLITIPIRKIKFFISQGEKIDTHLQMHSTINTINEFYNIYSDIYDKKLFKPKKDSARIWIKTSYNATYFCIADQIDIVSALNRGLPDQNEVYQKIQKIKKWDNWQFKDNIWYNPIVKGSSGKIRSDPVLLTLGTVDSDNQRLIWDSTNNLCEKISEALRRFQKR